MGRIYQGVSFFFYAYASNKYLPGGITLLISAFNYFLHLFKVIGSYQLVDGYAY